MFLKIYAKKKTDFSDSEKDHSLRITGKAIILTFATFPKKTKRKKKQKTHLFFKIGSKSIGPQRNPFIFEASLPHQ